MHRQRHEIFNFNITRQVEIDDAAFDELNDKLHISFSRQIIGLRVRPKNRLATTLLSKKSINTMATASKAIRKIQPENLKNLLNENLPSTKNDPVKITIGNVGILGAGVDKYIAVTYKSDEILNEQQALDETLFCLAKLPYERSPRQPHISLAQFNSVRRPDIYPGIDYLVGQTITLEPVRFNLQR